VLEFVIILHIILTSMHPGC